MPAKTKILIYHDSLLFGGHERMFLELAPGLAELKWLDEIVFCISDANDKFAEAIQSTHLQRARVRRLPYAKGRGEPYFAPLRLSYAKKTVEVIREERPSLMLLLQGRIENALVPLLAARRCHVTVSSYIPMAHSVNEMGKFLGKTGIPDFIRGFYYRKIDRFIVPSAAVERQIRAHGVMNPVDVVSNVVQIPDGAVSKKEARSHLQLSAEGKYALFIGRIDRHQKGLDRLVAAMKGSLKSRPDWRVVFLGSGPDSDWLVSALKSAGCFSQSHIVPWTNTPSNWYIAADVVLMPSRFEGVPLTMIEALLYERPVLASTIDVFRDYLPAEAVVQFGSELDLPAALEKVCSLECEESRAACTHRVLQENCLETSRELFRRSIDLAFHSRNSST